jgi:hypothetical protein
MHNARKIDLLSACNIDAILTLEHNDFWMIVHPLRDAIPTLKTSYVALQGFVEALVNKAGDDGAANMPNSSFIQWCASNPSEANKILEGAKDNKPDCLRSAVFALDGLKNFGNVVGFLRDESPELQAVGFRALGRLGDMSEANTHVGIDYCYDAIRNGTIGDARVASIEAAFSLWDKEEKEAKTRQDEVIDLLLDEATDDELVQVCAMLFYHKDAATALTIGKVLGASQRLNSNFEAATHWIESALTWKDDRWAFHDVVTFFEVLIPKLEKPATCKEFRNFCDWVWKDAACSSYLFSRWLNFGDFALCSFLAEMVGGGGNKDAAISLGKKDLPVAAIDQIFLARKCIGFLWLHAVSAASVLLSLTKHGHSDARKVVEELLWEPLFLSYSGELKDYLEAQKSNPSKRIQTAVLALLDRHAAYVEGLKQAQEINELEPSNDARRAAALKDHQRNSEIQKQAREQSIFGDLFKSSTLLYGKKSFTMITDGSGKKTPSINALSEHTYSFEFPRLSVVDPVGFNGLILTFRTEQRAKS